MLNSGNQYFISERYNTNLPLFFNSVLQCKRLRDKYLYAKFLNKSVNNSILGASSLNTTLIPNCIYLLESYFFLLLHNYYFSNFNKKKRVFSLYPVTNYHFSNSSTFFPPIENTIKFRSTVFNILIKKKMLTTTSPLPSYISLRVNKILYHKNFFKINLSCHSKLFSKNKSTIFKFKKLFKKFYRILHKKNFLIKRTSFSNKILNTFSSKKLIQINKVNNLYRPSSYNLVLFKRSNKFLNIFNKDNDSGLYTNFFSKRIISPNSYSKSISTYLIFNFSLFFKNIFFFDILKADYKLVFFLDKLLLINNIHYYNSLSFNIIPHSSFNFKLTKLMVSNRANIFFKENILP